LNKFQIIKDLLLNKIQILNKKIFIEFQLKSVIFFITFLYAIFLFGGFPSNNTNNFWNLFLIVLPSIITFFISKIYPEKIQLSFEFKSIILTFLIFILYTLLNYYSPNLYSDEIYYSHKAIRFSLEVVNQLKVFFFGDLFDYKLYVRLINLISLLLPLLLIRFLPFNLNLVFLVVVRLIIWKFSGGIPNIHPPLSSMVSYFLIIPFGVEEYVFKVSTCLSFFFINLLIFNFLRVPLLKQIWFYSLIFFLPILGNNLLTIEQSVYFPIFLFWIVILIDKVPIKYLSIIIGFSILFRASSIVFIIFPIILSIFQWESRKEFFINTSGILIGLPIFLKSILEGTPTTNNLNDVTFDGSLLDFSTSFFNQIEYSIFYIIILLILIKNREIKKVISLTLALLCYLIIFKLTNQNFEDKYIFEFYGAIILLSAFYGSNFKYKILSTSLIITIVFFNIFHKYEYIKKNNSFSEILGILGDDSKETLFVKRDYYNFSRLIKNNSFHRYENSFAFEINYQKYLSKNFLTQDLFDFKFKHLISNKNLPNKIVFMESKFKELNLLEKNEIYKYYNLEMLFEETNKDFEFAILSLK